MKIFKSTPKVVATAEGLIPSGVSPADLVPHSDNGVEIPEVYKGDLSGSFNDINHHETHSRAEVRAETIVHSLLENNPFAVAREIAIRTYDSAWFSGENDVSFKVAMAAALANAFSKDGYSNTVWNTISGNSRI